jgi:L-malate glycosyltransferase
MAFRPIVVASVRDTGVYLTPMMRRGQKMACRFAHSIVANSNAVRDWLVNDGISPDHISVIRNGVVVPEAYRPSEFPIRKQLGIPLDAPVIATVSRVNRSKGLEYLLQSAVAVLQRLPNARLLIVGEDFNEPGYRAELERLSAQLGLGRSVFFLGERKDISNILQESTVFVLPSLSEGLSNVLLEAMAVGLPIVATNVGGNPEVVEDGKTGLLVPSKNPEELTRALCQILETPNCALRFGDAGRARAIQHFSIQSMVRQVHDLYGALLEKHAPHLAFAAETF